MITATVCPFFKGLLGVPIFLLLKLSQIIDFCPNLSIIKAGVILL